MGNKRILPRDDSVFTDPPQVMWAMPPDFEKKPGAEFTLHIGAYLNEWLDDYCHRHNVHKQRLLRYLIARAMEEDTGQRLVTPNGRTSRRAPNP